MKATKKNDMKNFFPIFRAGKHTDSAGKVHEYSEDDVRGLFENYDPDWLSAPFSTDHKEDGPAFGYAKNLKYEDGVLYASFGDMNEDLRQAVKNKQFGRVSVELFNQPDKGRYLKAISLLGVKTPAVKGLEGEMRKQTQFSQTDTDHIITFEAEVDSEGVIQIRDSVPVEASDDKPEAVTEASVSAFAELTQRIEKMEAEHTDLTQKYEQSESERRQAEARLQEIDIERQRLHFEQYLEEKMAYGSVLPRQKDKIMELLMALDSVEKFAEGEEGSPGLVSLFQDFLNGLGPVLDTEEVTRGEEKSAMTDPVEMAGKIVSYMQQKAAEGVTVSHTEALNYVKNQNKNEK